MSQFPKNLAVKIDRQSRRAYASNDKSRQNFSRELWYISRDACLRGASQLRTTGCEKGEKRGGRTKGGCSLFLSGEKEKFHGGNSSDGRRTNEKRTHGGKDGWKEPAFRTAKHFFLLKFARASRAKRVFHPESLPLPLFPLLFSFFDISILYSSSFSFFVSPPSLPHILDTPVSFRACHLKIPRGTL